jgi:hypothetical protein
VVSCPTGLLDSMDQRVNGFAHRMTESGGGRLMVWGELGSSSYVGLLEENQP